jgi:hypothetical protein
MGQLDGIAVGLRGCPRPIEWSKERQDGDQEQEHEVGQCDSVVGVFSKKKTKKTSPILKKTGLEPPLPTLTEVY